MIASGTLIPASSCNLAIHHEDAKATDLYIGAAFRVNQSPATEVPVSPHFVRKVRPNLPRMPKTIAVLKHVEPKPRPSMRWQVDHSTAP